MVLPDLKKSIKKELSDCADYKDILETVLEVFNDNANKTRVDLGTKQMKFEVIAEIQKAFESAEEYEI